MRMKLANAQVRNLPENHSRERVLLLINLFACQPNKQMTRKGLVLLVHAGIELAIFKPHVGWIACFLPEWSFDVPSAAAGA